MHANLCMNWPWLARCAAAPGAALASLMPGCGLRVACSMLSKAGSAAGGAQATRATEVSSSESGEAADEDEEHGGSELARECAPSIVDWDSVRE